MDLLTNIMPYSIWIIGVILLLLPSSTSSKKVKELESRVEELERQLKETK